MFLSIKKLIKTYKNGDDVLTVLKSIDLNINQGNICVILGPSGSGKSTLLNIIGGLETADSGNIEINGQNLLNISEKKLSAYRRNTLGFVFQSYNLIGNLTVKENIETGMFLSKNPLNLNQLIDELSLTEHQYKFPNQLSGGQQQRTSIGRAMIKNPKLLLCDEPTGALDYYTAKDVLAIIEKMNRNYQTTIVIVTHNEAIAKMAHQVVKLRDGNIDSIIYNDNILDVKDIDW